MRKYPALKYIKQPSECNTFTANPLDRGGNLRHDKRWIKELIAHQDALFLPLWKLKAPITVEKDAVKIVWLTGDEAETLGAKSAELILLGLDGCTPRFAFSTHDQSELPPILKNGQFEDVRKAAMIMQNEQASILAQARSFVDWHQRNQFCAQCGLETELAEGGSSRKCKNQTCGAVHFPRTDPVVIMLVHNGEFCLLGRQDRFPQGFFSVLAGFVEPGESIEEAVCREVSEETSVKVGKITYHSSQPWPFPSSLMIGCLAEATETEIKVDSKEIAEAFWVRRDVIATALKEAATNKVDPLLQTTKKENTESYKIRLPPPMAIAHQLLKSWIEND